MGSIPAQGAKILHAAQHSQKKKKTQWKQVQNKNMMDLAEKKNEAWQFNFGRYIYKTLIYV